MMHPESNSQWLATINAGLDATVRGLYTYTATLFGFGPKLLIW